MNKELGTVVVDSGVLNCTLGSRHFCMLDEVEHFVKMGYMSIVNY